MAYDNYVENGELSQLQIHVKNNGYKDEGDILVATTFSSGYNNLNWICEVIEGQAICPAANGTGNLSELIDLNMGDELAFTFNYEANSSGDSLDAEASIALKIPEDDIYSQDNQDSINVVVSANQSGSWYDPETPGHGIFLERLNGGGNQNDRLNMYWFTHQNSKPVWMGGVGEIIQDQPVTIDLHIAEGAGFPPNFITDDVSFNEWGNVSLNFEAPHSMSMDWSASSSEFGTGSINLTQLSKISDSEKGCYSGSFYNHDQSGHGLFIHVTDTADDQVQINTAWFTYHNGDPFWLVGSGILNDDDATLIPLNQLTGVSFFDPAAPSGWSFDQSDISNEVWGELSLSYRDQNNIGIEYSPNDTNQFQAGQIDMTRLTEIKGHTCD